MTITRLFFLIGLSISLLSDSNAQFFLNGDAIQMSDSSCYQLTLEENGSAGSAWNPDKIDLGQSFEVVLEVFLGCKDSDGADGLVFGFQPVSTSIGTGGGGIGFGGVSPALGIELDTWQNSSLGDPTNDHVAIIKNGILDHNSSNNLAGPVQASASNGNIEDCNYHDLRVSWDAESFTLRIYFDCELRLTYSSDIVNEIFNGDPLVYWGFTSGTGAYNNFHRVCLKYTTFLDQLEDVVMCPGGQVPFQVTDGVSYSWSPSTGLDDPFSPTPIAAPEETTLYTVEIKDNCDNIFYDDVLVEVAGNPVFFDLGPDTTLCEEETLTLDVTTPTALYRWSDGSQEATNTIMSSGNYWVTVTRTDTFCIATDNITVSYTYLPEVNLPDDTILCKRQQLILNSYHPEASEYLWQDGSTLDSLIVKNAGNYQVTLSNICGAVSDQVNVEFENCRQVFIPNVFSPNSDGINDLFMLMDNGDVSNIRHFAIFDRWGGLVFEQNDILPNESATAWDGGDYPQGVYVWYAEVEFRDGFVHLFSGDVTLVR